MVVTNHPLVKEEEGEFKKLPQMILLDLLDPVELLIETNPVINLRV
jgi:hypothetical protein